MSKKNKRRAISWLKTSVWAFPLILAIFFLVLTCFKISGTSVGSYHPKLFGEGSHDYSLIYGHPQSIRSDEWLVGTQLVISQTKNGFPRVSHSLAGGQDLSLSTEIPVKDWPAFFKPQNWILFILPVEYAFAFKWWLLMYLLIIACYFFTLRILPKEKTVAILLSIAVGLSPFELWWFQSGGFLSITYGLFMAILAMRIIDRDKVPIIKSQMLSDSAQVLLMAFLMVCFGLILYPPFQIPIAIVLVFLLIGFLINKKTNERNSWRQLLSRLGLIFIAMIISGFISLLFIYTHKTPIVALNNTIYPGHRVVESGDLKLISALDGFVMPALQSNFRGPHFINNQSESSNFILLLPFLILPSAFLIFREWRNKRKIDWAFLAINICALLFFLRAYTPYGGPLFKLMLLHKVPNFRLIIGFGFVGIIQIIYILKKIRETGLSKNQLLLWSLIYGAACFAALLIAGHYITKHYPLFIHNMAIIVILAGAFCSIIVALLSGRRLVFAILLLLFTLLSSYRIIPLYRGLGILTNSAVIQDMEKISKPSDAWVSVGDDTILYENLGLAAGRKSISGAQIYPVLNFWKQIAGTSYEPIYNREGHVIFTDNPELKAPFKILQGDAFFVKFGCSNFIKNNAQFALSVHSLDYPCLELQKTVNYPATTFYLYKIN